jgi:hypothetical protein
MSIRRLLSGLLSVTAALCLWIVPIVARASSVSAIDVDAVISDIQEGEANTFFELSPEVQKIVVEQMKSLLDPSELQGILQIVFEGEVDGNGDGPVINGCPGGTRVPYERRWMSNNNGEQDWIYRFRMGSSYPSCRQLLYQPAWSCWPMQAWPYGYQYKLYYQNGYWYIEVVLNPSKVCGMTCYCNGYFEMEYR